jgi:hypothetical protein
METKTSKGKEIRIPGPDHPITISPAEGTSQLKPASLRREETGRSRDHGEKSKLLGQPFF